MNNVLQAYMTGNKEEEVKLIATLKESETGLKTALLSSAVLIVSVVLIMAVQWIKG